MTRIVGGAAGGRRLRVPPAGTRPTSDRVREAVFSTLTARLGSWAGLHVLDGYAGSGALGLEAASRGSAHVLLVERDRRAAVVCHANAALFAPAVHPAPRVDVAVVTADIRRLSAEPPQPPAQPPYGLVLLDPPYLVPAAEVRAVLDGLQRNDWLTADAMVVVERSARDPEPVWPTEFESLDVRRYGETAVWYGRSDHKRSATGTPGGS